MDGKPEPQREITRVPTDADLVSLARELNRLGVAYVVVGGFAINRLGFVRATEDIDLMTEPCGVRYEDTAGGIETEEIKGVRIPFAGTQLMLTMKQSPREKDVVDRNFLQQLIPNS